MEKPTQEELNDWFKAIDADGSGKIDRKELYAVVKAYYEWHKEKASEAKMQSDVAVSNISLLTYCSVFMFTDPSKPSTPTVAIWVQL